MIRAAIAREQLVKELETLRQRIAELEALRQQRDRAQTYLDIAGVMIVAIDSKGKVTLMNKKGCETLGFKLEEVLGEDWFDHFLPERNRDSVRSVFNQLIAGQAELAETMKIRY